MAQASSIPVLTASAPTRIAWQDLLALTRPRVTLVAAITGWPALILGRTTPSPASLATVLGGLVLLAAGCSALNAWIERDRDALMTRTRLRPLPARRLDPGVALAFGAATSVAGLVALAAGGSVTAAAIGIATLVFYLGPYTSWAKAHTAWSAVVGAVPGAAAPLIADAAVHQSPTLVGWTLFAIVFLWQAPHVWTIELFRTREYVAAGLPTMPVRAGAAVTRRLVLAWTGALVPVTLLPWLNGTLGALYGAVAVVADLYLLTAVVASMRHGHARADRNAFLASLVHVTAIFAAMIVEPMLH
jgi:protoheme IX farnesyltransferase